MAATDLARRGVVAPPHGGGGARPRRARNAGGPDRFTVMMLALAAFLVVLALLASQLRSSTVTRSSRPVIVLRRVYETKVIETVGGLGPSGTTVSQSSSPAPVYTQAAVATTRTS